MRYVVVSLLLLVILLAGCGSGSPPPVVSAPVSGAPQPLVVAVHAPASTIEAGATMTLSAVVLNATNTKVTWHVNGKAGGDATCGMISSGVYTAPKDVTAAMQVTVTVIAEADSSKSASVVVTVMPERKLIVETAPLTLQAGATQKFSVRLSDGSIPDTHWVAWQGAVAATGEYTAPLLIGKDYLTVYTLNMVPTKVEMMNISVVHSKSQLNGSYVFAYDGFFAGAHIAMAGLFSADGKGNISGGILDSVTPAGVQRDVTFTGNYDVGPDGRGVMTLSVGGVARTWRIAVPSPSYAVFAELDGPAIGSGVLERQSGDNGIPEGVYLLTSSVAPRGPAMAGKFLSDAATTITGGEYDLRRLGAAPLHDTFSGSMTLAANGRGTATLSDTTGSHEYRIYRVAPARIYGLSLDAGVDVLWSAQRNYYQTLTSGAGVSYILSGSGMAQDGPIALMGGPIQMFGSTVPAVSFDEIRSQTMQVVTSNGATYTVGPGRAQIQFTTDRGTRDFIAYVANVSGTFVSAENGVQMAGRLDMTEGPACEKDAFFSATGLATGGSWVLGNVGENLATADVRQNGTVLLGQTLTANVDSALNRRVLRLSGSVTRNYSVYGCSFISLDPQVPEVGFLSPPATIPPLPENPWFVLPTW